MAYTITIDSENRTTDIIHGSVTIEDTLNDKANTCDFELVNKSGLGIPQTDDEIVILDDGGTRIFAGYILKVSLNKEKYGEVSARIRCIDYTRDLDRNLAHISYDSQTDKTIIEDLISRYRGGAGITTTNVIEGVTIDQISFNYVQLSRAIRKIAELSSRNWYIDYNKDIHYFPLNTEAAPFDITATGTQYHKLQLTKDSSQLKNRIYVRGGTKLSDFTTYSEKGDGEKRQFILPDKPSSVTVEVNGVAKSVGIKNIDTSGFDWYLNYQEKYLEQDSAATVLSTTDTLTVTYKYMIPILIAQEDTDSIEENGVHEFAIFDKEIETTNAARDRAIAELTDYANDLVEGSFTTYETGFHSGQTININHADYDVNADYIVQSVSSKSYGGGNFHYVVKIASAKTMGIIRFLIKLLEANRNLITLDDDEVVDELFTISDTISSVTESLSEEVSAPPFVWSNDAGTTTNKMRWNLFEWS